MNRKIFFLATGLAVLVFLFTNFSSKSVKKKSEVSKTDKKNVEKFKKVKKLKTKSNRPQIAIIFDDLGESVEDIKRIYDLDIPVTIAIIPGLKFSKNIARIAKRSNFTVFVHMPMQSQSDAYKTDRYEFLSGSLSPEENKRIINKYLDFLPQAFGVNNHMGSKATRNKELMQLLAKELKKRDLVFVDSKTAKDTVAFSTVKKAGVKSAINTSFIDSVSSFDAVKNKLSWILKLAKKNKKIIIIGHPRKNTFAVLMQELPKIKKDFEFITMEQYFANTD